MRLYLTAKTNIPDVFIDYIEVQLKNGGPVSLNWDESDICRTDTGFDACYKGVYFGEEYANGRILDLEGLEISDIGLYFEAAGSFDFQIAEMQFEDDDKTLAFEHPVIPRCCSGMVALIEKQEMTPSWFRVSNEAVEAARKMVAADRIGSAADYKKLREQFMKTIPAGKDCFLGTDYSPAMDMCETLRLKGCLGVFDPEEDLIAVISKDDVLHKEDFAVLMKEAGMETTEGNFYKVWNAFLDKIRCGYSLRDSVMAGILAELKPSLSEQIQSASACAAEEHSAVTAPLNELTPER